MLDDLSAGVASTVDWADAVPLFSELGIQLVVQLPPGDALARLTARQTPFRILAMAGVPLDDAVARIRDVHIKAGQT